MCMLREAVYTGGYLGTAPLVKALLMGTPSLSERPNTALLLAGVVSGATAAVLTQPLDTVKTRMQAKLSSPEYSSPLSSLRTVWAEGGARKLWAGLLPRGGRIVLATIILSNTKRMATAALDGTADEQAAAAAEAPVGL